MTTTDTQYELDSLPSDEQLQGENDDLTNIEGQVEADFANPEVNYVTELSDSVIPLIRTIQIEVAQVRETRELEKKYSLEVDVLFKKLLALLGKSFDLRPSMFPKLGTYVSEVILTPEGFLFLRYIDGGVIARPIIELSPESIHNLLSYILPEVALTVEERWRIHSEHASMLEKLVSELRKLGNLPKKLDSDFERDEPVATIF